MAKQQQKRESPVEEFSPAELSQIQGFGHTLSGTPTDFDKEVAYHLRTHEANAKKMQAARTGGSPLGPSEMEQTAAQQQGAMQQQAGIAGQAQATQAQAAQAPTSPPPAPSGPAGTTQPYPAQRGETPPGEPETSGSE